jgi:hypothetical protein
MLRLQEVRLPAGQTSRGWESAWLGDEDGNVMRAAWMGSISARVRQVAFLEAKIAGEFAPRSSLRD